MSGLKKIARPYILALSGGAKHVDICLTKGSEFVSGLTIDDSSASSMLVLTIEQLLSQSGLALEDIGLIAVNVGPGAFTSTRVLVVVANALAWVCKIPILAVNSFELLLQKYALVKNYICNQKTYVCLINAYSRQVFGCVVNSQGVALTKSLCLSIEQLCDTLKQDLRSDQELFWLLDGVSLSVESALVFHSREYKGSDSFALAMIANRKLENQRCLQTKVSVNYVKEGFAKS